MVDKEAPATSSYKYYQTNKENKLTHSANPSTVVKFKVSRNQIQQTEPTLSKSTQTPNLTFLLHYNVCMATCVATMYICQTVCYNSDVSCDYSKIAVQNCVLIQKTMH